MIAIRVRYCPATNHRGARLVATDGCHRMTVPYGYGKDDQEKLALAIQFKLKYLPHSPELNPTPTQFDHDDYFRFYPKCDSEKLEELLSKFPHPISATSRELIKDFVNRHCVLK